MARVCYSTYTGDLLTVGMDLLINSTLASEVFVVTFNVIEGLQACFFTVISFKQTIHHQPVFLKIYIYFKLVRQNAAFHVTVNADCATCSALRHTA